MDFVFWSLKLRRKEVIKLENSKEVITIEDVCKVCGTKDCDIAAPVYIHCEKIKDLMEEIRKGGEN